MEGQRGQSEDDCAPPHRNTSFFIDNILRPDFGCRRERRARCRSDGASSSASSAVSSPASGAHPKGEEADGGRAGTCGLAPASAHRSSPGKDALWPAWVYCTRYSDRPSSGPRTRRLKGRSAGADKRGRTAFTAEQLQRLRAEFLQSRYIAEQRRRALARELGLHEAQVKIWFQNKRAKIKKSSGSRDGLATQLMAQGLYNHSTTTAPQH